MNADGISFGNPAVSLFNGCFCKVVLIWSHLDVWSSGRASVSSSKQQMDLSAFDAWGCPFWLVFSLCRRCGGSSTCFALPVAPLLALPLELQLLCMLCMEGLSCLHPAAIRLLGVRRGSCSTRGPGYVLQLQVDTDQNVDFELFN